MERPVKVGIVLGSDSDLEVMMDTVKTLDLNQDASRWVLDGRPRI